jgi:hypothetical protein
VITEIRKPHGPPHPTRGDADRSPRREGFLGISSLAARAAQSQSTKTAPEKVIRSKPKTRALLTDSALVSIPQRIWTWNPDLRYDA